MSQARRRSFKYYDLVMALFVTILLCSNVIGAAKVATVSIVFTEPAPPNTKVKIDGEDRLILREEDILGVIEK